MTLEEYCRENNVIICYFNFTTKIKGLCLKYEDYYYVAINPKYSNSSQIKTLKHEVIHIMENHFQCPQNDIEKCESDVHKIINDFKLEFADEFYIDITLI